MANTGITQAAFVVGIVISIYYFFLFLLLKGKNLYHLWFAAFSLGYSICYTNMAFNFPANSFLVLEKVSRSGFALVVIVLVFFFTDYLGIQKKGRIGRVVMILDSVAAVVCLAAFWSRKTNTGVDAVFNPVMTYYIFPNLVFCLGLLIVGAAREKFKKHKVLLIAFGCIFATAAHDISFVSSGKTPYAFLLSLGFLAFILAVFFVMAAEQAKIEADTKATSIVIEKRGKAMALIMDKVKSASGSIVSCTDRVREIAKASIEGVAAYEEDSRGIQELVGSRLGDLERTVSELNESLGKSGEFLREAIESQARLVGGIARSVEAMNARVGSIRGRTASSGDLANHLAGIARESSTVIDRARKSIDRIRESSGFIRSVLDSINDISEQTSILSINAAIEAARAGESGKGFTIVASSIRGLASKTKETVDSSLVQLNGMNGLLAETDRLSNDVSDVLATIVRESDETAIKVNEASAEVDSQEGEFGAIMESTQRMAQGQSTIKSLSDKDAAEKREHMNTLQAVRGEFTDIAEKLKRQRDEGKGLRARISELEIVVSESAATIALLQSALSEEG
jgi:septal ring factor EnvC (AmiA/AmiB activator)